MENQWIYIPTDEAKVENLQHELKIHPLQCRLLVQRGITEPDAIRRFLHPDLKDLHDPFLMRGMAAAVSRIRRAINQKERILLYGDYDVDGVTSVALLFSFLENYSSNLDYYIPDRYHEGYGVSMEGIEYARKNGVNLMITLDCGITAVEQAKEAAKHNIDLIIVDHHIPGQELPKALAILDPLQPKCDYPYKSLSGCGIAFKLVQGLCHHQQIPEEEIFGLLDLVAVSIASDIVPMTGENRVLAHFGLIRLNHSPRLGLKALIKQSGRRKPLTISDIVFGVGPLINAAGRVADATLAVKLLLIKKERNVVTEYSEQLGHLNQLRRDFDKKIAHEANIFIEELIDFDKQKSIVLFHPQWHKGVLGIAASRMVEKYHRPAIILTASNGQIVGSARSVPGFDLYEALKKCEQWLLKFGGHRHAAGLTLAPGNLKIFSEQFEMLAAQSEALALTSPEIKISGDLQFSDLSPSFWKMLKRFAPFGPENRNPVFVTKKVKDTGDSRRLKNDHLKLSLRQDQPEVFQGIAFGKGKAFEKIKNEAFDICYNLQENHWKGETSLQLNIKDFKFQDMI